MSRLSVYPMSAKQGCRVYVNVLVTKDSISEGLGEEVVSR